MKKYNLRVEKTQVLKGKLYAPPSKSYTIRALICAGLNGRVKIFNPLYSQDTEAAIKVLRKLGAIIKRSGDSLEVRGFRGRPSLKSGSLNVGESATLLRLVLPVVALARGRFLVKGEGTLLSRSNKPIAEALLSLGVSIKGKGGEFRLPILIEGKGQIPGGEVKVSAKMSSQTISSLLNIAPLARQDTKIIVRDKAVSRPYIDITLDVLRQAGIKVRRQGYDNFFIKAGQNFKFKRGLTVGGDYSSAAFLITACCLVESDVVISDMARDKQGDRQVINILNSMGAKIRQANNEVIIKGPFELKARDIDCGDTPDLVPVLAVAACFARGKTRIFNISHLAHKESNRIAAPAVELRKLGARVSLSADSLTIEESVLRPGIVSGCNDHRIAMALAVAGLKNGGILIKGVECIRKSYPRFILDMKSLGAKLILEE